MPDRSQAPRKHSPFRTATVGSSPRARAAAARSGYRLRLQASLVASLLLVGGVFHLDWQPGTPEPAAPAPQEVVSLEEIQATRQQTLPPPPPRPPVPVAVSDDTVLDDEPLDLDASLDLDVALTLPAPPPPAAPAQKTEEVEQEIFIAVEEMPTIRGGMAALYKVIQYPELARQAAMEGLVVVEVVIEPDGRPTQPRVVRSAGDILDEAAVAGVMQCTFVPGRQRGTPVRVRFAVPVRFRLKNALSS